MSVTDPEKAIHRGLKPYEIHLGVRFRPFKGARDVQDVPKSEEIAPIPEDYYPYKLALRKPVLLYGIKGFFDIMTDQPFIAFLCRNPIEKPLGDTYFKSIYSGPGKEEFLQEPRILRFSFYLRRPRDFVNLLNTYADVKIGKQDYVLAWNYSRPRTRSILQLLNKGQKGWLVEKNLFNANPEDINEDEEIEEVDHPLEEDQERITCVWLPPQLKKLRTPEFVFHRIDHGDDQFAESTPPAPEKELIPA